MKNLLIALLCVVTTFALQANGLDSEILKYFELRNDIAVEILYGDEDSVEKAISKATAFFNRIKVESMYCPVCKGKKPMIVTEPDHGQNAGRIKKSEMLGQHKITCPICNGKGKIRYYASVDSLQNAFSSARIAFEAKKLADGLVKTNGAFLISTEIPKVTPTQMQAISLVMGHPCRKCKGTGITECRKCKGEGMVRCRNSGCRNGWFKKQKKNSSKTKYPPTFTPCPKCKATETILCKECDGRRAEICKECVGKGFTQKKR